MSKGFWDDAEVVSSYSRAQAIADGVLVDLTPWARETGFKFPVAITRAAWESFIAWPENDRQYGQSERGRAHDVLSALLWAVRAGQGGERVDFKVARTVAVGNEASEHPRTGALYALCGPGDDAAPVLTIMLPGED